MLKTETPSRDHTDLDLYAVDKLVDAFIDDQSSALVAVRAASAQIAAEVRAAIPRIDAGGRLIYVGAGTSGRLGMLDSVELYPTFSWPRERALALIAGGQQAMFEAIEGAEDSAEQGGEDIRAVATTARDVVLLLAASGTTPYVTGALAAARDAGALTIGMANNPDSPLAQQAECGITLDTGAELISGSTRLKAGTAQKIALNTFSSALMVRLHKVHGNLMVDMKATNAKLIRRTIHLTMLATGVDAATAQRTLEACDFHVKVAIVALKTNSSIPAARQRLAAAKGNVRNAIAD